MQIEIVDLGGIKEIENEMRNIGVTEAGVKLMASKYVFKIVKLKGVRNAMANILKQEMLSLGGEAAVHRDAVNCQIEETDVLLGGTLKIYGKLVKKLKIQVSELKEIGEQISSKLEINNSEINWGKHKV